MSKPSSRAIEALRNERNRWEQRLKRLRSGWQSIDENRNDRTQDEIAEAEGAIDGIDNWIKEFEANDI